MGLAGGGWFCDCGFGQFLVVWVWEVGFGVLDGIVLLGTFAFCVGLV